MSALYTTGDLLEKTQRYGAKFFFEPFMSVFIEVFMPPQRWEAAAVGKADLFCKPRYCIRGELNSPTG